MQSIILFICITIFLHQAMVIKTQNVDIVQTAINNGNFKTLVRALEAADLVTTLKGNGPFTVFAPNDAAFNKLPAGTLDDLLKPENKGKLGRILKYHVISGQSLTSTQINAMNLPAKVTMLEGDQITVSKDRTNLKVNDATVIIADVMATNGIIHVIDTVLMPPAASSATYFYLNQPLFLILIFIILFSYLQFL
ncbi:unnamed protein product [Rotaria sp. Silwood1]|nr:unnamed protein product [Rotaria sp. Silwood1]CAF4062703.1 unnamed protein product [Rotaria sp. Silwood1]CAF5043859.1 unnamed protein product [Rotaria sp. Silwood1]